jgi:hypothetical protein
MDTLEIYRTLSDLPTFAEVFASDLLPTHPLPGLVKYTLTVNTDAHTELGSHWVAVHLETRSSIGYYFDMYGLFPPIPALRRFLRQACTLWSYNTRTLQDFTTDVCGQYACLFALCMDRGFGPHQLVNQFWTTEPDVRWKRLSRGSLGNHTHALYEGGSAAPAGKVSIWIL